MDYTTLIQVKAEAGINEATDDTLIGSLIIAASRWLDRELTGKSIGSDNYLLFETVANEVLYGQVDKDGNIVVYAHKPLVTAVTAMMWRPDPVTGWVQVDINNLMIDGYKITAFNAALANYTRGKVQVTLSYTGGVSLDVASLPDDLLEDVTTMTIRLYRENKTALTNYLV